MVSQIKFACLVVIVLALFNQSVCLKQFDIENVPNWLLTDITNENNIILQNISDNKYSYYNSETLQISDTKMVAMLNGLSDLSDDIIAQKLVVYDSMGQQTAQRVFSDVQQYYVSTLGTTNVKGEFLHVINYNSGIYISVYDEDLNITRNTERQLLDDFSEIAEYFEPIVSVGKDMLYLMCNVGNYEGQYHNMVYVLDLSDTSTIRFVEKFIFIDYSANYFFSFNIQAFPDGSAISHFYATDSNNSQPMLVQTKFSPLGKIESGYPININTPLVLSQFVEYYPWHSFLHEDGELATFLATDQGNNLLIYTFDREGNQICAQLNDISGYNNLWYYYGLIGSQGWIYLADSIYLEGHFGLFDVNECRLNLDSFVNTQIFAGVAGYLIDLVNQNVLVFEFGNLADQSMQLTYQARVYQIGIFSEGDMVEGEGEDLIEGEDLVEGEDLLEGEELLGDLEGEDIIEGEGEGEDLLEGEDILEGEEDDIIDDRSEFEGEGEDIIDVEGEDIADEGEEAREII